MPLQLFVDRFEIRMRASRRPLLVLAIGKQRSFEPFIIPIIRQRPSETGSLGAF